MADATDTIEASFASKLVATIDPNQPVIDAVVLRNVGLRLPSPSTRGRLERVVALHGQLATWYSEQLVSAAGIRVLRRFRAAYPRAQITDVKALDLVLWQVRDT